MSSGPAKLCKLYVVTYDVPQSHNIHQGTRSTFGVQQVAEASENNGHDCTLGLAWSQDDKHTIHVEPIMHGVRTITILRITCPRSNLPYLLSSCSPGIQSTTD